MRVIIIDYETRTGKLFAMCNNIQFSEYAVRTQNSNNKHNIQYIHNIIYHYNMFFILLYYV